MFTLIKIIPTIALFLLPLLFADPSWSAPTAIANPDDGSNDGGSNSGQDGTQIGSVKRESFPEKISTFAERSAAEFVTVKVVQRDLPTTNSDTNILLEPRKRWGNQQGCCGNPGWGGGGGWNRGCCGR
jgi:hypothetical protein